MKKYTFDPVPPALPVFRPLLERRKGRRGEWALCREALELITQEVTPCAYDIYERIVEPSDLVQVVPDRVDMPKDGDVVIDCDGNIIVWVIGDGMLPHGDLGRRRVILREVKP